MLDVEGKNIVTDLTSSKQTWVTLGVPEEIQKGLKLLAYQKPSLIQSFAIPQILKEQSQNFVFQSINGSGKTGSFIVPSLMRVDPKISKIQVLILANTRELIRQIQQVGSIIGKFTEVKIDFGDSATKLDGCHILVTTPGYLKSQMNARSQILNLDSLKMVVFDEADELLLQTNNHETFKQLKQKLKAFNIDPQFVLFSATYSDDIIENARSYVGEFKLFTLKKEALKLTGVQTLKIQLTVAEKLQFVADIFRKMGKTMSMIFVNQKKMAVVLKEEMKKLNIEAQILIGGMEN